jgi:3',5'-cyclic-AMP phosphodiesterase
MSNFDARHASSTRDGASVLIAHISDTHIRAPGELAYRRVDTAAHLRRCIAHILALVPRPDIAVATGDLVDRGLREEYRHLAEILASLPMPLFLIPGNHDERQILREEMRGFDYLEKEGEFIQYVAFAEGLRFVALDTVVPGEGGGLLCGARLAWLEDQLAADQATPTIILMHHPPFTTGIAHMDNVGLKTAFPLEPIIRRSSNIERILCGHLHRSIQMRFGGTIAITCPSPAHQVALDLAPGAPSMFVMEPPGYLLHRWTPAGVVTYGVVVGDYPGPYPFYEDGKVIK